MTADLAILYDHPWWFEPLFAALERRGRSFVKIPLGDHISIRPPARRRRR